MEAQQSRINIGHRITELRNLRKLSQRELARRCNIDQAQLSRIERGLTAPTIDTLSTIAQALNARVELITN